MDQLPQIPTTGVNPIAPSATPVTPALLSAPTAPASLPSSTKSNAKIWLAIIAGIVVISVGALSLFSRQGLPEMEVPEQTAATRTETTAEVATTTTETSDQKAAALEVDTVFKNLCEENAGDFDESKNICTVLTVGNFESSSQLAMGVDAHAVCAADKTKKWNSESKTCEDTAGASPDTSALLKGSLSEFSSTDGSTPAPVDDVISIPDETTPEDIANMFPVAEEVPVQEFPLPEPPPEFFNVEPVPLPPTENLPANEPVVTSEPVASNDATSDLHGAYIQGKTGPGMLLYPLLIAASNGAYYLARKKKQV